MSRWLFWLYTSAEWKIQPEYQAATGILVVLTITPLNIIGITTHKKNLQQRIVVRMCISVVCGYIGMARHWMDILIICTRGMVNTTREPGNRFVYRQRDREGWIILQLGRLLVCMVFVQKNMYVRQFVSLERKLFSVWSQMQKRRKTRAQWCNMKTMFCLYRQNGQKIYLKN